MPLLELKIQDESRSFVSQSETTKTDKDYQILKTNIKKYVDSNLSNSCPFTFKI